LSDFYTLLPVETGSSILYKGVRKFTNIHWKYSPEIC